MAINYPTSLDTLTNPASTDNLNSPSHSSQHANINDIAEALQAKVGADSSAVTTSHDYKLSGVTGSDLAVSLTGTETLTNKTLTAPVISTISNTGTVTLPTDTDTLVGRATTDTLTNKTFNPAAASNTFDGDKVEITFSPVNYTPTDVPSTDDAGQLGAYLNGIDLAFAGTGVADDELKVATVSLSAANIIGMNASPVEIVAAPGAGKIILVDQFLMSFTYGTTQFTGGGDYRIEYGGVTGTNIMSVAGDANVIKAAANDLEFFGNVAASQVYSLSHINSAVNITNAGAAFADGDGTLKIFIRYRVITL